jgi:hypothetical protein
MWVGATQITVTVYFGMQVVAKSGDRNEISNEIY